MITISIIGSMKRTTLMCVIAKRLQSTVKDCIVFIPDMSNAIICKNTKNKRIDNIELNNLKAKHMKHIEISDIVLCIDSQSGKGTKDELKYAKKLKKNIVYFGDIVHYFHDDEAIMKAIKGD